MALNSEIDPLSIFAHLKAHFVVARWLKCRVVLDGLLVQGNYLALRVDLVEDKHGLYEAYLFRVDLDSFVLVHIIEVETL